MPDKSWLMHICIILRLRVEFRSLIATSINQPSSNQKSGRCKNSTNQLEIVQGCVEKLALIGSNQHNLASRAPFSVYNVVNNCLGNRSQPCSLVTHKNANHVFLFIPHTTLQSNLILTNAQKLYKLYRSFCTQTVAVNPRASIKQVVILLSSIKSDYLSKFDVPS